MVDAAPKLSVRNLTVRYGDKTALDGISLDVLPNEIFGIIGPANSGKTSFLRALNRMEEFDTNMTVEGDILFEGQDITAVRNVYALRRKVGVVFPLPVGLPMSVYENVAFAPKLAGIAASGASCVATVIRRGSRGNWPVLDRNWSAYRAKWPMLNAKYQKNAVEVVRYLVFLDCLG